MKNFNKAILFIIFGLCFFVTIGLSVQYRWDGSGHVSTPGGYISTGDTANFDKYLTGADTLNWTFISHQGGVDPFLVSIIVSTIAGSWDTISIDLILTEHIDIIASDSVEIFLNDTTGITPLKMSEYWTQDVYKTVSRIIVHGLTDGRVEIHATRKDFE